MEGMDVQIPYLAAKIDSFKMKMNTFYYISLHSVPFAILLIL
jgi:hypothetical protein